jgi:cytoskeletal protein CcmA (bactofilin family)
VGPNIKLKGSEITDCDILLVEGRVEASMHSRDMRIAEGGIFVGVAEIDTAEVRGTFEGELIVRKRLIIHATGKVTGKIRYGALTVDEGGTLTGDVGSLGAALAMAAAQEAPRQDAGATTAPDEGSKVEDLRPAASVIGRNTARVR